MKVLCAQHGVLVLERIVTVREVLKVSSCDEAREADQFRNVMTIVLADFTPTREERLSS
jgi:hypothetical protein